MDSKKILFVINTLGRGGAETAMLELMRALAQRADCRIDLYVMMGQGDLVGRLPPAVRVLNRSMDGTDVLSAGGRRRLYAHTAAKLLARCSGLRNLPYIVGNGIRMYRAGSLIPKNLLWKAVSDGSRAPEETYDLAVAFIEGAAAYFVADRVSAAVKVAFVHTDYRKAGYSRWLDHGCYSRYQAIYCVSEDVRSAFLSEYPEHADRTDVFRNIIDPEGIRTRAKEAGGFSDPFAGARIVSLGRLVKEKNYESAVAAARILTERGHSLRWYVFGEGEERAGLEREIRKNGMVGRFILAGAVENPFPYLRQAQIYVQCSKYEGQSVAVREAKVLGLPVVLSRTSGNRGQITDGVDGIFVGQDPASIADGIERLLLDPALCRKLGEAAAGSEPEPEDVGRLLQLLRR